MTKKGATHRNQHLGDPPAEEHYRYMLKELGRAEASQLLGEYSPEALEGVSKIRQQIFPREDAPVGALDKKFKELVLLAILVTRGRGKGLDAHVRNFIRYGGTAKELHEVMEMCLFYAGWPTYVDSAVKLVRLAERYEASHKGRQKKEPGKPK